MNVSLKWLKEYVAHQATPDVVAQKFLEHAQEVAHVKPLSTVQGLKVGHVLSCEKHPNADKLSLTQVSLGDETLSIICGAPNVAADQKVIVAPVGVTMANGLTIEKVMLKDYPSEGMICSLEELGIDKKYHGEEGIHVLAQDAEIGADALAVMQLDDVVMELDLTPNRADLLSMFGVAYEAAALLEAPLTIPYPTIEESLLSNPMKISTQTSRCEAYYGRVLDTIEIRESPQWLKSRLIASGVRPINNVVDITNYVMLETGQPLHAFDYDALGSQEVVVREATEAETFKTLDGQIRQLKAGDILITNGNVPIALGGVMGGFDSEVETTTRSVLLESARFHPTSIRHTSRRLDLRSESSMRFERGVDPQKTRYALERATALLVQYAGATVREGIAYFDHYERKDALVELSLSRINRVLGTQLTVTEVSALLERLRFSHEPGECFYVTVPTRRQDIQTEQDLIEEVGRLYGFNQLPSTLPKLNTLGGLSPKQRRFRQLKNRLNTLGLHEAVTYALVKKETLSRFTFASSADAVQLKNPLSEDRQVLALTPLNGLVDTLRYHQSRQMTDTAFFEIGKRYTTNEENDILGLALANDALTHWQGNQAHDFYRLKGLVDHVLALYGLTATYQAVTHESYHPYQCAKIFLGDIHIGHLGALHPSVAKTYDLKHVFLAEINLTQCELHKRVNAPYVPISKTPIIQRDLALVVPKTTSAQRLIDVIEQLELTHFKDVEIFDVYEGEPLKDTERSLALRLRFNNPQKTLETAQVDEAIETVLKALKKSLNITVRDA